MTGTIKYMYNMIYTEVDATLSLEIIEKWCLTHCG